jgi:hypothetical protein
MIEPARAVLAASGSDSQHRSRGNIIPLRRTGDAGTLHEPPPLHITEADRPAEPSSQGDGRVRLALILFASLLIHSALFALFRTQPEMMASIGEDAIIVEIVVGADSAAGVAQAQSDVEAEQQSAKDVPQEQTAQEKPIKEEPTPQPRTAMTPPDESLAQVQREVTPPEHRRDAA